MRTPVTVLLAAAVLLGPAAASAGAEIVVGRSIAGVALGDDVDDVKDALGEPRSDRRRADEIQGTVRVLDFGLTHVVVGSSSGTVQSITTRSRAQRTRSGIGVGSTRKALRAKVRGVRCQSSRTYRLCTVGRFEPGRAVTTFRISSKARITEVSVGYVID